MLADGAGCKAQALGCHTWVISLSRLTSISFAFLQSVLLSAAIKDRSFIFIFSISLLVLVAALHFVAGDLIFTGDETRYVFASVSAWLGQGLAFSPESWAIWLSSHGVRPGLEASRGTHSIIHSILLSPFIAVYGVEIGRWAQLVIVSVIAAPFLLGTDQKRRVDFAIWTTVYFVSIPVLPYLRLVYPATWMFLLLSVVLFYCSKEHLDAKDRYIALACVILLPFIHIRTALVAVVFAIYLFYKTWSRQASPAKPLSLMTLMVLISLPLFVWYQVTISGKVTGTASVATVPSVTVLTKLLSMQYFGYRHGLFFYNPLALVGLAGLFLGVIKKNDFLIACLIAFFAYSFSIAWGTASESYAGRFWVAVVPLLIYGSVFWFRNVQGWLKWPVLVPLAGVTLFNCVLFVTEPNFYIENRFGSLPYEFFQHNVSEYLDFGLIAATDPFEAGKIVLHDNDDLTIFSVLIAFVLCVASMGVVKPKRRLGFAILAVLILGFAGYKSLLLPVAQANYAAVTSGIDENGHSFITFRMKDRERIRGFKVGHYSDKILWGLDDRSPREFSIAGVNSHGEPMPGQVVSGYQLTKLDRRERYSSITITATNPPVTRGWTQSDILLF